MWCPGITSFRIPRPAAARPRPPTPGGAPPCPARPRRGCGPYLGGGRGLAGAPRRLDTGGWRRGGCYLAAPHAWPPLYANTQPAWRSGSARPGPRGRGERGGARGLTRLEALGCFQGPPSPRRQSLPRRKCRGSPPPPSSPTLVLFTELRCRRKTEDAGSERNTSAVLATLRLGFFPDNPDMSGRGRLLVLVEEAGWL